MKLIITMFAFIGILALTGCGNAPESDNSSSAPTAVNTNSSGGVTITTNTPPTTNSNQ